MDCAKQRIILTFQQLSSTRFHQSIVQYQKLQNFPTRYFAQSFIFRQEKNLLYLWTVLVRRLLRDDIEHTSKVLNSFYATDMNLYLLHKSEICFKTCIGRFTTKQSIKLSSVNLHVY